MSDNAKTDFASMYYYTTTRTRGRGRFSDSAGIIKLDDVASTSGNVKSAFPFMKPNVLDSDDSDDSEGSEAEKSKVKENGNFAQIEIKSSSSSDGFSDVKLIDRADNIVKYSCTTLSDFPGQVLTRGPLLMTPLGNINHFKHARALLKGIKSIGLYEFNSLQKSVIPHFLRGDECFILGGVNSGKSLSYLMPIVGRLISDIGKENSSNIIQKKKGFADRLHGQGPSAIIVCSDQKSAMRIEGYLFSLFSGTNQREISYGLFCEARDIRKLQRGGVDILITSVFFFSNFLDKSPTYIGFEKLLYFVFDDVDTQLQAFSNEFSVLNDVLVNIMAKHSQQPIQRIYCGRDWCPEVEDLYMDLSSLNSNNKNTCIPTLFINSATQTIKYSEMKWQVFHCSEDEKSNQLIALLRSSEVHKHKSIFVVCNTPESAIRVHKEVENNQIEACLAESKNMTRETVNQIIHEWNTFSSDRKLMILNEDIMKELNIHDVTCLIHYEMPEEESNIKGATGANRFSCMWSNIRDITREKNNPNYINQRNSLESYLLLTGNERALYKLTKFALNLGCVLPESLSLIADDIRKEELERQIICDGIVRFGRCIESVPSRCKGRHSILLRELKEGTVVPRNGEIEVRIAECVNPSVYTAQVMRIFEYKDGKRKLKESLLHKFNKIAQELAKHYENPANRIPPVTFQIGTTVAVDRDGLYRAKIIQIFTRDSTNHPKQLKVFCIDTGNYLSPVADQLYKLPEELEKIPQLAVKLILANLQPPDGILSYGSSLTARAKELTVDKIFNGRIQFVIGETVWVNPLVELEYDELKSVKPRVSVRLNLMQQKCAQHNDDHLKIILELCRNTGYECPELEDFANNPTKDFQFMSTLFELEDNYFWAYLKTSQVDFPERNEVWSSYTHDPYFIFGTPKKFEDELEALQDELNAEICELISEKCASYQTCFSDWYKKGLVVAVKDRVSQEWKRGLISEVFNNGDDDRRQNHLYEVFLVDVGDSQMDSTTEELFPIPRKFVHRLPFQIIAFRLSHIRPTNGASDWDPNSFDNLTKITLDENNEMTLLDVVAMESLREPLIPCKYYRAIMLTKTGEDVGELLVENECAEFVDDGKESVAKAKKNILAKLNKEFERNNAELESNSDEEVDNDFEDVESQFDVVGFNPSNYAKELGLEIIKENTPSSSSSVIPPVATLCSKPSLPQIGGFSPIKHPEVFWKQTKKDCILIVNHPDIKNYTFNIEKNLVTFRTQNPPDYGFDLELFGAVEQNYTEFCTGQYLKFTIKKRTKWLWPRSTKNGDKFRWLKEDIDSFETSDSENVEENFNINLDEDYEDDTGSDDDSDVDRHLTDITTED